MKKIKDIEPYRAQLRNYFLYMNALCVPDEMNELINEFKLESYPKHHVLLKAGDNSDMVYFICEGLVRIYYTKEDKEITNWFIKENMMSTPIYSILTVKKFQYIRNDGRYHYTNRQVFSR